MIHLTHKIRKYVEMHEYKEITKEQLDDLIFYTLKLTEYHEICTQNRNKLTPINHNDQIIGYTQDSVHKMIKHVVRLLWYNNNYLSLYKRASDATGYMEDMINQIKKDKTPK